MKRHALAGCLCMVVVSLAYSAAPPPPVGRDYDAEYFRNKGVATDTASLVRLISERAAEDGDAGRLTELVKQLGDDSFARREDASRRLRRLGEVAVPALKAARGHEDPEVRRRVRQCLAALAKRLPESELPGVIRILRRRGCKEIAADLLHYLPTTQDNFVKEQIYHALVEFSEAGVGKELLGALEDRNWERRSAAAVAVGRNGTDRQREVVRRMLKDPVAEVRLRAAQGLLAGQDAGGIRTLIEILEQGSKPQAWEAEELLRYAAQATAPREVLGDASAGKRKGCRAAWQAWAAKKPRKLGRGEGESWHQKPALVLVVERVPLQEDEDRESKLSTMLAKPVVRMCGGDGLSRAVAFGSVAAAFRVFPQADNRAMAESCLHEKEPRWLARQGKVPPHPTVGWPKGPIYRLDDPSVAEPSLHMRLEDESTDGSRLNEVPILGSGNTLVVNPHSPAPEVLLVERAVGGGVVWESEMRHWVAGFHVCPLVRVGFPEKGMRLSDLSSLEERIKALHHPDAVVRKRSQSEINNKLKRTPQFFKEVGKLFRSPDREIRLVAGYAFIRPGVTREMVRPLIKDMVPLLDEDYCGWCLANRIADVGEEGMRLLAAVFEAKEVPYTPRMRANAISGLMKYWKVAPELVTPLFRRALKDRTPEVRRLVACHITNAHLPASLLKEFAPLLEDSDDVVAAEVVRGFAGVEDAVVKSDRVVRALIRCLRRPKVRLEAIIALGNSSQNQALDALELQYRQYGDEETRGSIAYSLGLARGKANQARAVEILMGLLAAGKPEGKHRQVYILTIDALGKIGSPARKTVPALLRIASASEKGDKEVVKHANEAIERIRSRHGPEKMR